MRWARFILIGMLLFSLLAVNLISPTTSEEPRGTRSPGADVEVTAITQNQTGIPTGNISYVFEVKNTGDEQDNFTIIASSEHGWLVNWTNHLVGPLTVNGTTSVITNITIPVGTPANTMDNLSFRAISSLNAGIWEDAFVNTTVNEAFVLSIDIEGRYNKTSSVDPPSVTNYTLSIRNKGNVNITITLKHTSPSPGWQMDFYPPKYSDGKVTVDKANFTEEAIENVNITITAPSEATPGETMTLSIWAEKTDIGWSSRDHQDDITLITIVQTNLEITFYRGEIIGNISSEYTIYNFTLENTGNKDILVDLEIEKDLILDAGLRHTQLTVRVGYLPTDNYLMVSASASAPLGNYTINVTVEMNGTDEVIGFAEFYYIIVPELNVTNILVSEAKPLQFKTVTLSANIENIGYVDASDIIVKFYDGSKKIGETHLDFINASQTAVAEIQWSPSDFGNRSIRVEISVDGVGNFSEHGTGISEKTANFDVKINWQPYYLTIYIIIVIVLGIGVIAGFNELRYYGGARHPVGIGETEDDEEYPEEDFPSEDLPPLDAQDGLEKGEERPFGTYGVTTEPESIEPVPPKPRRGRRKEKEYIPPPAPRRKPPKEDPVMAKDPETARLEHQLKDEIARVSDDLDKTKSQGVDTSNIDQLLRTAKKNLADGDHTKAKQYLGYATERLKNLMAKREEAVSAIREAKEVLSGMRGSADLTIVENFLVKADSLLSEGEFREAINYAKKAKDRAQRLQRKEMRL